MRPLEQFFFKYGELVARKPTWFIIVPIVCTIFSTIGFVNFHSEDDIWDIYAPLNGLSRVEENGLKPFEYASGSHHYRMQILVSRKDGGNLLDIDVLEEISRAHKYIVENVTAHNGVREWTYREICGVYCNDSNAAIVAFLQTSLEGGGRSAVRLTFPNAQALQKKVFIGYSVGDLSFNKTQPDVIEQVRLLILHYMIDTSLPKGKLMAQDFEVKLREIFGRLTDSSGQLKYALLSRMKEIEEQRDITLIAIPFLGLTVLVLTGFMVTTLIDFPLHRSQHLESLIGVFSPGMALWTSAGILWAIGYPFSNILTVVPFLVITIGIDDAFLILAGWRHSTKGASLEHRMGESVAISGASVTVTSVTDVLCFAIGLFSNMPVVQLFCLYTTVALFIDYVYQMTFFTALVSLIGKRQIRLDEELKQKGEKSETSSLDKWKAKLAESSKLFAKALSTDQSEEKVEWLPIFVSWLHTGPAKIFVMMLFCAHIGICSYYATKVNTDFDMENLYLESSPLTDISRRMQDFVLRESFVVNFAVRPMPDLGNETIRDDLEKMVKKLENIANYGAGEDNTNIWTREFSNAIAFWGEDEDFWSKEALLRNFREYGMEDKYIITKKEEDGTEVLDGFFFFITYHNMSSFLEVESMMELRRAIIAEFPQFTVLSHHPFEKVPTESAASAPSNFIQTVVSAVILMSLLVLLFVMNIEAIISVVVSIISICLGVIAYLHLWDVHLDAVSLISILMSIGFSVDYSAHVCYHYFAHAAEEQKQMAASSPSTTDTLPTTHQRILSTLQGVGWPVVQSGLSTILGMFPLMFVHAYVVAVFWKTILLVGFLGMAHALLLLPVIFIITHDLKKLLCSTRLR